MCAGEEWYSMASSDDGTKRVFEADVKGKTNQFMLKFQKPRH